jgi:hypothetical protein
MSFCQSLDHSKADVVPMAGILASGIAQSHDQERGVGRLRVSLDLVGLDPVAR